MYLTVIFLPFINFVMILLFGQFLGHKGSQILIILNIFLNFCISYWIFYEVSLKGSLCFLKLSSWFNIGLLNFNWGFFLVHIYSIDYMKFDPFLSTFLVYLSFFTFFMLILITADNLIQLFIGWRKAKRKRVWNLPHTYLLIFNLMYNFFNQNIHNFYGNFNNIILLIFNVLKI